MQGCTAQGGGPGGWRGGEAAHSSPAAPIPTGLGVHSLVRGVAVADHLRQDPLLVPIHSLDPGSHFVSRFGHVVPRGGNGPTERGWPEHGMKSQSQPFPPQLPRPGPALTCHQASQSTGAGSWLTAAAESSAPLSSWSSEGAPSHCTGRQSWPLGEGSEPLRHRGQGVCPQAHLAGLTELGAVRGAQPHLPSYTEQLGARNTKGQKGVSEVLVTSVCSVCENFIELYKHSCVLFY